MKGAHPGLDFSWEAGESSWHLGQSSDDGVEGSHRGH